MGVNDIEKSRLKQEIANLKKRQLKASDADIALDVSLSKMREEVRGYEAKYDEQLAKKKAALERKKFTGPWDPKLPDALEIMRRPLQSYGENCEKAVAKILKAIEKALENGASENKALRSVDAAIDILNRVERCSIYFDQISKTLNYHPTYAGVSAKESLKRIKNDLLRGEGTIESQIKKKEEIIRRIDKADKYGVALDKLDTHESYLAAVKYYEGATTGSQLRTSAQKLKALGVYLNSHTLFVECDKKVKAIEKVERAEKAFSDAKKALVEAEKEVKSAELEKERGEIETKNATLRLQNIESRIEEERAAVVEEYTKNCTANYELVMQQSAQIESLTARKNEIELSLRRTFFLAFRKKKEIREEIARLSASILDLDENLESTKKKNADYLAIKNQKLEAINDKVASAKDNVKNAFGKLCLTKHRLEKARIEVINAQNALETATQKLRICYIKEAIAIIVIGLSIKKQKEAEDAKRLGKDTKKVIQRNLATEKIDEGIGQPYNWRAKSLNDDSNNIADEASGLDEYEFEGVDEAVFKDPTEMIKWLESDGLY